MAAENTAESGPRPRRTSFEPSDPAHTAGTTTAVAVYRHPIHPMLITFPIAFLVSLVGSDLLYLYEQDPFWARMSLWLVGGGAVMGALAGLAGTVELLAVREIRRRAVAWNHFVAAVMMLSVAFANWIYRLPDPAQAILPWGLYLSVLGLGMVAIAGWLGGHLVFEHRVGVEEEPGD